MARNQRRSTEHTYTQNTFYTQRYGSAVYAIHLCGIYENDSKRHRAPTTTRCFSKFCSRFSLSTQRAQNTESKEAKKMFLKYCGRERDSEKKYCSITSNYAYASFSLIVVPLLALYVCPLVYFGIIVTAVLSFESIRFLCTNLCMCMTSDLPVCAMCACVSVCMWCLCVL